ncbi:hypothetical protein [Micromonospora sp. SH-82]|uniref:hypothetical protein n=1 Tax=Micromonospora sp. SH-82 TaxID=3132938 RepID=UPI003EBF152F
MNPPGGELSGWWSRCIGVVRRGWTVLLPLLLITQVLPAIIMAVLVLALGPALGLTTPQVTSETTALPDGLLRDMSIFITTITASAILIGLLQSVGWAAGTWVITRQAVGGSVTLGSALRYGLSRAPGLWGWTLLVGLLVFVGICLCFLPGIYLAAALSLAGPVYLFERSNPIGRSFQMFHSSRFGMLVGRLALMAVVVIGIPLTVDLFRQIGMQAFDEAPLAWPIASPGAAVGALAVTAAASVLTLPAYLFQQVALVVTYAEQRIHEGPVDSARLAAELG